MSEINEIYRCNVCGNMAEMVHSGMGVMICCDNPMELLEATKKDEGGQKHIPVIKIEDNKVIVDVGEVPHPMEEEHWINFIELCVKDQIFRQELKPGDKPSATFDVISESEKVTARIYCNLHGLWPSD